MDIFFLQLAIIFIPGLIWERIHAQYGPRRASSQFDVLRRAFVFGLGAYILTFGIYWLAGWKFDFLAPEKDRAFLGPSFFDEIGVASAVALLSAIGSLYVSNYKLVTKVLQAIRATKRYGDEDVWDFTFNSREAAVEYVHLRDFDKRIVYAGYVDLFSETDRVRELVLRDVRVYDFEGAELFVTPRVYVSRALDKIDIEFPYRQET